MGLFAGIPFISRLAHAGWWFTRSDPDAPKVPVVFKWDIAPKDSRLERKFTIPEDGGWDFDLGFGSSGEWNDEDPQEWRKDDRIWLGFVGQWPRSSLIGLEKWTADALAKTGVIIPIHLRVERLDDPSGNMVVMADRIENTQGRNYGGKLVGREIAGLQLPAGKYRVIATTLRATDVPKGMGTYLAISSSHRK